MAHLLGTRECIESLKMNVVDLQKVVNDICKMILVKPNFRSWRSPDVSACELDISALLEKHSFCKDLEENQLSHVVLFELVIDRLALILQLSQNYICCKTDKEDKIPTSASKSIGVIARRFWNVLNDSLEESKISMKNMKIQMETSIDLKPSVLMVDPFQEIKSKRTCLDTGSQTMETMFVGCSSCKDMQLQLTSVMSQLIHFHNSITKEDANKIAISKHMMSGHDVSSVIAEYQKSLEDIEELFQKYDENIKTLKLSLAKKNSEIKSIESTLSKFMRDSEIMKEAKKSSENKIKTLEKIIQKLKLTLEMNENLNKDKLEKSEIKVRVLEEKLEKAKQANNELGVIVNAPEECGTKNAHGRPKKLCSRDQRSLIRLASTERIQLEMKSKLENGETARRYVESLENEMEKMTEKLEDASRKLSKVHVQMKKEWVKNQNNSQHVQLLQSKQNLLIKRIEMTDEKNEELLKRASEAEMHKEIADNDIMMLKVKLKTIQNEMTVKIEESVGLNEKLIDLQGKLEKSQAEDESLKKNLMKTRKNSSILFQKQNSIGSGSPGSWTAENLTISDIKASNIEGSEKSRETQRVGSELRTLGDGWSCIYCGEKCGSISDRDLHVTYCAFKS